MSTTLSASTLLAVPMAPLVGAMLARETNLAADIVIAGMPAAEEPLPDALLARINPKVIVLTDSLKPAAGRASRKLRERLGRRGVPVFCTSDLGAVTLQIRNGRWTLTDASGAGLASGGGAD